MGHVYAIDARRSYRATRKTTSNNTRLAETTTSKSPIANQSNSSTSNTQIDGFYKQTSHEQNSRMMIPDNELVIKNYLELAAQLQLPSQEVP